MFWVTLKLLRIESAVIVKIDLVLPSIQGKVGIVLTSIKPSVQ